MRNTSLSIDNFNRDCIYHKTSIEIAHKMTFWATQTKKLMPTINTAIENLQFAKVKNK